MNSGAFILGKFFTYPCTDQDESNESPLHEASWSSIHLIYLGQYDWFDSFIHALTEELFLGWTLLSLTRCMGQDATSSSFSTRPKGLLDPKVRDD